MRSIGFCQILKKKPVSLHEIANSPLGEREEGRLSLKTRQCEVRDTQIEMYTFQYLHDAWYLLDGIFYLQSASYLILHQVSEKYSERQVHFLREQRILKTECINKYWDILPSKTF